MIRGEKAVRKRLEARAAQLQVGRQALAQCLDNIASADSLVVGRMRAAGAIFVGKTNVPEFALGSHSYNRVFGITGNAFDPVVLC